MSKTFRPYDPEQQLLLPAALQEWLPPDHLAYFISDVVDQLDLSANTGRYQGETRGGPPYHPGMMVNRDDGQGVALRLLRRRGLLPAFGLAPARGHRLPGAGGQQTSPTSAPSPTSGRTTWRRSRNCSCRCWPCANRRDW